MRGAPHLLAGLVLPLAMAWGSGPGLLAAVEVLDQPLVVTVVPDPPAPLHRLQIRPLGNGERRLELVRPDAEDLTTVVVTVKEDGDDPEGRALRGLLRRYEAAATDGERTAAAEALVLAVGATDSRRLAIAEDGRLFDRTSGRILGTEEAWALYTEELRAPAFRWRMIGEIGLAVSIGAILYDTSPESRIRDADYGLDGENFRAKFVNFESWRFDDNLLVTNTPGHALAGGLYHTFARTNGFTPTESFLITLAASSFWELVLEYDEVTALNDMVLTPIGGFAVGEAMFHTGRFFSRSHLGWLGNVLGFVANPGGTVDRWFAGTPRLRAREVDVYGLPADTPHQLDVTFAAMTSRFPGGPRHDLGVTAEAELFHLAIWDEAVPYRGWIEGPVASRVVLGLAGGDRGLLDFRLLARSTFAGRLVQDVRPTPGGPRGWRLLLGLSTAFEHVEHRTGWRDAWGLVHLPGPNLDAVLEHGPARLRWTVAAWPDFATIRPVALDAFIEQRTLEGTRRVLANEGYYFGFGWTGMSRLVLERRPVELGAEAAWHAVDSIDGRDRFQDEVTNPVSLHDRGLELRAWLGVGIPGRPLRLTLGLEHRLREGAIEAVSAERTETRLTGGVQARF